MWLSPLLCLNVGMKGQGGVDLDLDGLDCLGSG